MKVKAKKMKLLKQVIFSLSTFLIIFLLATKGVYASNFKYSEFNFEKFAKENADYWSSGCAIIYDNEDDINNCQDKIIKSQEKYYTRLYKLLASYQRQGLVIDDSIIIATTFFEFNPSDFNDLSGAYNLDDDEVTNYMVDNEIENAEYMQNETDTLKLLLKAMVGYEAACYGLSEGQYIEVPKEDSTSLEPEYETVFSCLQGSEINYNFQKMCSSLINKDSVSFWEKFFELGDLGAFFGLRSDKNKECYDSAIASGFVNSKYTVASKREVIVDGYWKFLEESTYFDNKDHLQYRYAGILNKLDKKHMDEVTVSEKEEYSEELSKVRKKIVADIKDILEFYNSGSTNVNVNYLAANYSKYWWPIGGANVTEDGGIAYALDNPTSTVVRKNFGLDQSDGESSFHKGVDLVGASKVNGTENIIASNSGTITQVFSECLDESESSCGGGYGNYVEIVHADGVYTFYAHLSPGSITVKVGETVKQGQVIGKMGSSGTAIDVHLHFEVRLSSSNSDAIDPLKYINPDEPRPVSSSEDFLAMLKDLEGIVMSGNEYKVYCNPGDPPTVGHGVTLTYHYDKFAKYGMPLDPSQGYYNYCGTTMPVQLVDKVFLDILDEMSSSVKMELASNEITLEDFQVDALLSLKYNCGNINGFVQAYNDYGTSVAICNNWWHTKAINWGTIFEQGHLSRRERECKLFVTGDYGG